MKGLSVEDQAFLDVYRATDRRRREGTAHGWEVAWLRRHAALAAELTNRAEYSAKAA